MAYKFMNVAFELKMCTPFFKHYLIFYEKEEVVHCMYISAEAAVTQSTALATVHGYKYRRYISCSYTVT